MYISLQVQDCFPYSIDAHLNELLKVQERERKLLDQDKKVEQAMDQRNTLLSFVYDTRSKVLFLSI